MGVYGYTSVSMRFCGSMGVMGLMGVMGINGCLWVSMDVYGYL